MAALPQYNRLATRYAALTARAKAGDSLVPDTAYADFLRDTERQSLPNAVPTSPPSLPPPHKGGDQVGRPRGLTAIAVRERAQQSLEDTNRQLKAIDDHMWQHRQEERALKRAEMDVVKQRRNVERTMKKLNDELVCKQEEEVQQMAQKEEGLVVYQQKVLHDKGSGTKERMKMGLAGRQRINEQTKKFMKKEQELSWRYQNLANSVQMKRNEIEQLSKDFEKCIRAKEEEQHSLKKDLASLAITMNMEAQKKRQMTMDTGLQAKRTTAREILNGLEQQEREAMEEGMVTMVGQRFQNRKRDLEQTVQGRQDRLQARHRQEGRKLMDVHTKQKMNFEQQRFTASEAEQVHLDMMGKQIEARIQEVEAKKTARMEEVQKQTAARNRREVEGWSRRMGERENEAKRQEHAQRLKQLSKVVGQCEAQEHTLYSKARGAESVRRKQVQVVDKLQEDLEHLKKRNAIKLKEAALQAQKAETELNQKILRETAELTRAANVQHEASHSLVSHRQRGHKDKRMLIEEKKEHQRRSRIANRTTLAQTL